MNNIIQDMKFHQSQMKYSKKYGVSTASRKYNKARSYIYYFVRNAGTTVCNPFRNVLSVPAITKMSKLKIK